MTTKNKLKEIFDTALSEGEQINYSALKTNEVKEEELDLENLALPELLILFEEKIKVFSSEFEDRHLREKHYYNNQIIDKLTLKIEKMSGYKELITIFTRLNNETMLSAIQAGMLEIILKPLSVPNPNVVHLAILLDYLKADKSRAKFEELKLKLDTYKINPNEDNHLNVTAKSNIEHKLREAKTLKETVEKIKDKILAEVFNKTFLSAVLQNAHFLKRMHLDYLGHKVEVETEAGKYKKFEEILLKREEKEKEREAQKKLNETSSTSIDANETTKLNKAKSIHWDDDESEVEVNEVKGAKPLTNTMSHKGIQIEYPLVGDEQYEEKIEAYHHQETIIDFFAERIELSKLGAHFSGSTATLEREYFNYDYFMQRYFDVNGSNNFRSTHFDIEKEDVLEVDYQKTIDFLYTNLLNAKSLKELNHRGLTALYNFMPVSEKKKAYEPYLKFMTDNKADEFYSKIFPSDNENAAGYSFYYNRREDFAFNCFTHTSLNYKDSVFPWAAEILDNINYPLYTPKEERQTQKEILSICLCASYGVEKSGYRRPTGLSLFKFLAPYGKAQELLLKMNASDIIHTIAKCRRAYGNTIDETSILTIEYFEKMGLNFNTVESDKWVEFVQLFPRYHNKIEKYKDSVYSHKKTLEAIVGYHQTHSAQLKEIDNKYLLKMDNMELIEKIVREKPSFILEKGFAKYMKSEFGAGFLVRMKDKELKEMGSRYKKIIDDPQWWSEVIDKKRIHCENLRKLKSHFPMAFKDRELKAKYYCTFFEDQNYRKIPASVWQSSDILVSMMENEHMVDEDKFLSSVDPSMWNSQQFVLKVMELFDSNHFSDKKMIPGVINNFLAKAGVTPGKYEDQMRALFDKSNLEFMLSNPGLEKSYYLMEPQKLQRGQYGKPAVKATFIKNEKESKNKKINPLGATRQETSISGGNNSSANVNVNGNINFNEAVGANESVSTISVIDKPVRKNKI